MTEERKENLSVAEPEAEVKKTVPNVFRNRNYRLVFFGALVSELGAVLYSFAVSFYILEISGNNAFLQGLYLALCGVVLLQGIVLLCLGIQGAYLGRVFEESKARPLYIVAEKLNT